MADGVTLLRADEATSMLGFLDRQRDRFAAKTLDLDTDALRVRLPPSTMTLGGFLQHLAHVEDHWFSVTLRGEGDPQRWCGLDVGVDRDAVWADAATRDAVELRARYQAAVTRSRDTVARVLAAGGGLDNLAAAPVRGRGADHQVTLRWILLHMITEYAQHNGHVDLLRESIDGVTG